MNNQINSAVRKIHNLLSSGAVTVTGPNQPRIHKQKVGGTTSSNISATSMQQMNSNSARCYVCDDTLGANQAHHQVTEMITTHTSTKFPNKIGQLVGDAFMVIVSTEDVVCSRCTNLINYWDRLENDVERVRSNLMNLLHKKYGLNDEGGGNVSDASPPIKMQKLNSGTGTRTGDESGDLNRTRKLLHAGAASDTSVGKQSPPVSAVQQIKISTQPVQQSTAGTQTLQRKTTKIYKCTSCEYKTSDMRLFNTHFETCKQQNFQCKNCKKIFPHFGAMKQHMVREHNTPMDNTCAVCHINFVNDAALRKHMEMNHATSVVVTSSTTIPAGAGTAADLFSGNTTGTPLYTCNHCQFKSTDKSIFDEHLRKHLGSGGKPKPFKCRLCAQRFETREAATVHAKQHQPNYFKCGTCSMSFPKRELLVKHFEVHQTTTAVSQSPQPQQMLTSVPMINAGSTQNLLTTQKLLQETIDEALSDSVASGAGGDNAASGSENNIRFYSCQICSLTFIQETYYNHHMETHRREKKTATTTAVTTSVTTPSLGTLNSAAAALLSDDMSVANTKANADIDHQGEQHSTSNTGSASGILEADIEDIFEKMHSDKSDASNSNAALVNTTGDADNTASGKGGDNLVITSQDGSGGYTINITIPQQDSTEQSTKESPQTSKAPVSVSIDMPMLDQPDDDNNSHTANESNETDSKQRHTGDTTKSTPASGPVSMPSLDDDNDAMEQTSSPQAAAAGADASESKTQKNDLKKELEEKTEQEEFSISEEHKHEEPKDEAHGHGGDDNSGNIGNVNDEEGADSSTHDAHEDGDGENVNAVQMATDGEHQVAMEMDEAMQAQVESGQIKLIFNENGHHILQLDNHIITDSEGNQIIVEDPEQIQQLLQSVGVLQSGDGLDSETLQMMTDGNGQMVLVQGENNETQLIDASLLNAEGQLVIQQGQDGGEGAHVIGEDGTRIPVSVSYTADGQPIVQMQQQVMQETEGEDKDTSATPDVDQSDETGAGQATDSASGAATSSTSGGFFALEDLMQQSSETKSD